MSVQSREHTHRQLPLQTLLRALDTQEFIEQHPGARIQTRAVQTQNPDCYLPTSAASTNPQRTPVARGSPHPHPPVLVQHNKSPQKSSTKQRPPQNFLYFSFSQDSSNDNSGVFSEAKAACFLFSGPIDLSRIREKSRASASSQEPGAALLNALISAH